MKEIESVKAGFSKVKGNKDYWALLSNFGYLTLLQVAGYLFPLINIPYLARVVGANGIGCVAFGSAVTLWFLSVSTWGFNYTATRDAARNRDNNTKLSEIFSNVFWARMTLMLICFVILLILIEIIPSFHENRLVLLISFLMIPADILFPEWMFQALERMKYITILSLLSKLIFTLSIFVFVNEPDDYYLQPLITAIGSFVAGGIALYFIMCRWKIKLLKPSLKNIFDTINKGKDIFINQFFPNLWGSMSVVFLGAFHGSVSNGIFAAGQKCQSLFQQFFSILTRTFFPFLSRHLDKHTVYAKYTLLMATLFSVALFLFAPLFVHIFYTEEFEDAIIIARILSPTLLFLTISEVYGTNYLILRGYEKLIRNITASVSLLGFFLALVLTYYFDAYGASITLLICRGGIAFLKMYYSLKIKKTDEGINRW